MLKLHVNIVRKFRKR